MLFEFLIGLGKAFNEPVKGRVGTLRIPGLSDKTASLIFGGKKNYLEQDSFENIANGLAERLEAGLPDESKTAVRGRLIEWGFRMQQAGTLRNRIRAFLEQLAEGMPNGGKYGELPRYGQQIFGRTKEVEQLHADWTNRNRRFAWIEADGGAGKTSVVIKWLDEISRLQTGRPRVCLFSFNDVSSGGSSVSSATFFTRALNWCGLRPQPGETVERRAERVVAWLLMENTVLVLDGIEGLQHEHGHARCGEIKDLGLRRLMEQLLQAPGSKRVLCLLTTRCEVRDLVPHLGDAQARATRIKLESLDAEAGRQILNVHRLHGEKAFPEILRAMKHHALALHLLGSYLAERYRGEARDWRECVGQGWDQSGNGHQQARHILHYYGKWLDQQPAKAQFLRLLALFLDSASRKHLDALFRKPAVAGLTGVLTKLSWPERDAVIFELARSGLVQKDAEHHWQALTLHPIIHEHFRNKLRDGHRAAWRAGNRLMAEELSPAGCESPSSDSAALLLLASLVHRCRAGDHREAYELYKKHVFERSGQRQAEDRSTWGEDLARRFGLWGEDLRALLSFTQNNDWRRPAATLNSQQAYFVIVQIGIRYRWLGRLSDCCDVMGELVRKLERKGEWMLLGQPIRFLSECHLLMGRIEEARSEAEQGVFFANKALQMRRKLSERERDDLKLSQVGVLTILANACHQLGQWKEAEQLFVRAQKLQDPRFGSRLLSVRGLRICQLLLDLERYSEVKDHADAMLEDVGTKKTWHLGEVEKGIALLVAGAGAAKQKRVSLATGYFQRGMEAVENSRRTEHIVIGRLMRAEFWLDLEKYEHAEIDLKFVASEARHDEMHRLLVDAQLLQTRLWQETGKWEEARVLFDEVTRQCNKMGYLRRARDIDKLRGRFNQPTRVRNLPSQ